MAGERRRVLSSQAAKRRLALSWGVPLALGLLLAVAAAALVVVELAEPPPQPGFRGIALSNVVNSPGARVGLSLFRTRLDWLPYPASHLVLAPADYIHGLRIAVGAMALVQVLALAAVLRLKPVRPWPWLVGPALASIILLAYPPVNTDVFSYASFGWESNQGFNPYLVPPAALPGDPFARMNDWTHITTPYGPIWTGLSRAVVALARNQPFAAAIGFKTVAGLAAIGLGFVTYLLARRLASDPGYAVGALVLVAWSPVLLAESAGTAHNDSLMMLLAVAGLFLAAGERPAAVRGGLLLLLAAVLIKPVALPLLGLAGLIRLAKNSSGVLALVRRWSLDVIALVAATGLAFAPYWGGGGLPSVLWENQRKLYFDKPLDVNPLWVWAVPRLAGLIGGQQAEAALRTHAGAISRGAVLLLLLAAAYLTISAVVRRNDTRRPSAVLRAQAPAWAAVTVGLGLAPINAHAWYAIWALAPLALVWTMKTRIPRNAWVLPYLAWMLLSFLVYHTWPTIVSS